MAGDEVREVTAARLGKVLYHRGLRDPLLSHRVKWGIFCWVLTNSVMWSDFLFERMTVTTGLKIDCHRARIAPRRLWQESRR